MSDEIRNMRWACQALRLEVAPQVADSMSTIAESLMAEHALATTRIAALEEMVRKLIPLAKHSAASWAKTTEEAGAFDTQRDATLREAERLLHGEG